jgi:pantoate kinase
MMKDGRIISKAASKAAKKSLKSNPKFQAFIDLAKEKAEQEGYVLSRSQEGKQDLQKNNQG